MPFTVGLSVNLIKLANKPLLVLVMSLMVPELLLVIVGPAPLSIDTAVIHSKSVAPELVLSICKAVPRPNLANLVPLLLSKSPAAVPLSVIVLLVAFIVLLVSVSVVAWPTKVSVASGSNSVLFDTVGDQDKSPVIDTFLNCTLVSV